MHIDSTHTKKKKKIKKCLECNRFVKSSSPSTVSFVELYKCSCNIFRSDESFKSILHSVNSVFNYSITENAKDINHFCCSKI